jgi:hypothetical protein
MRAEASSKFRLGNQPRASRGAGMLPAPLQEESARNGGNVAYKRDSTVADDAPSCVGSHTMVGTIFGVGLSIGLFGSTGAARCNASTYMEHLNSYIHQCPQRITVTIKSSERGAHSEQH